MDNIPRRSVVATPYRTLLATLEKQIALPEVSPSYYHVLGLGLSLLYLYAQTPAQRIWLIVLILIADWLDGATARRYGRGSRAGYLIDLLTDRISEAFIFAAASGTLLGQIFFLLWIVNVALAFYSVRSNKHTALPIRFAFLLILIIRPG
jgi:phosphatidylglycerophosphate synthase